MKTATKTIVFNKDGKRNKSVINMLMNCWFDTKSQTKVYTGYYSGSGRFTSAHSALSTVTAILKDQGYKFEVANDAARGGAKGEHVIISKTAFKFLLSVKNPPLF